MIGRIILNNHETSPLTRADGASPTRQKTQTLLHRWLSIFVLLPLIILFFGFIGHTCKVYSEYISPRSQPSDNNSVFPFNPTSDDQSLHQVSVSKCHAAGFPSYNCYAGTPYIVSYDNRALQLNGDRALFLGGSMHPVRATRGTWESALDLAVTQGLNLITIYVMWAEHQKFPNSSFDWSFSAGHALPWTLADAIQSAAQRGLFIHIRVGPYVCAEYSYGGIPEWVAMTSNRSMAMRRANMAWMEAMEGYLRSIIGYLQGHKLFAYQGGPIILAQIENELGEDNLTPERKDLWAFVDGQGRFSDEATRLYQRRATLQDYADWCGRVAQELAPNVIWTMCNGLSANTTIETYNGFLETTS